MAVTHFRAFPARLNLSLITTLAVDFRVDFFLFTVQWLKRFLVRMLMVKRLIWGVIFLSITLGAAVLMANGEKPSMWHVYSFNGKDFGEAEVPGTAAIALREGYLPAVASANAPREDRLPTATGGLALFCYIQSAGGKLKPQRGFIPMSGVVVEIAGKEFNLAARTDSAGYLILALPPGDYEVRIPNFSRKVRIEKGKNTLVAIRGGKRMVD